MRRKGINYDTGFTPGGVLSRDRFEPGEVRDEIRVIARDLHCTAIRISGADPAKIEVAARYAAEEGLEVWFAPFPCDLTVEEMLPLFEDCAVRAEAIRRTGAEVVVVTGCEMSLFGKGFLPGDTFVDRMNGMMTGAPETFAAFADALAKINAFLAKSAAGVRARFGGKVSYASGMWEDVDWTPFDFVAVDAYRDADNAATFKDELGACFRHGKPVVVTEFGCCPYVGAADRGGMGWAIVDRGSDPPRLDGDYVRDEQEQVRYLDQSLPVFEELGVDTAFWFTFALFNASYSSDPRHDLDMASYGVMTVVDGALEPKAVFDAYAKY
jgi:hypothetical protein